MFVAGEFAFIDCDTACADRSAERASERAQRLDVLNAIPGGDDEVRFFKRNVCGLGRLEPEVAVSLGYARQLRSLRKFTSAA